MLTRNEARRIAANAKLPEAVTAITRWIKGADGATPLPPGFEAAPRPGWRLRGLGPPAAEV